MKISSPNKDIYVEVKDTSSVYPEQLQKYKEVLLGSQADHKRLVLLTRYSVDDNDHQNIPDKFIRWSEIHDWFSEMITNDPVTQYLVESFINLLKEKKMNIDKVTWEYEAGVLALNNLMRMLEEAILGIPASISRGGRGKEHTGFYFESGEYWAGIYNHDPLNLIFEIEYPDKYDTAKLTESSYDLSKDQYAIYFKLPLESIYFFALQRDRQYEEIQKFISQSYSDAQKMKK